MVDYIMVCTKDKKKVILKYDIFFLPHGLKET